MQRRRFLKSSVLGASIVMGKLGAGGSTAKPTAAPEAPSPDAAAISQLVEIPGRSFETTDGLTNVTVTVTLGKFLISPTEVTQREFEPIMGYNPSFHRGPDLPVENVTWWEAIRYCNLRSMRENLEPCYDLESGSCDLEQNGYRLPTDAEWTYAADMESNPAPEIIAANLGSSDTKSVERLLAALKTASTKPVGSYPANRFGLYDMLGNVWEWSNDYFNPVRTVQASYNPGGPLRGLARIIRGGSFMSTTSPTWTQGYRSSMGPEYKSRFTGFRVCRTTEPEAVLPASHRDPRWFDTYRQPPAGYESATGGCPRWFRG